VAVVTLEVGAPAPAGKYTGEVANSLLAPSITRRLVERFAFQTSAPALMRRELSHLTLRELDVLRLLARGLSNAEIAAQLTLSEATVKTHVARLLAKLQLRDRIQVVILTYETGLVSPQNDALPSRQGSSRLRRQMSSGTAAPIACHVRFEYTFLQVNHPNGLGRNPGRTNLEINLGTGGAGSGCGTGKRCRRLH
jgi:DNA-binding CsgD family transcriptional regulator